MVFPVEHFNSEEFDRSPNISIYSYLFRKGVRELSTPED